MIDFVREIFSIHNLPCTILLGVVLLYWLLIIVGVLDNDFEQGGVDLDLSGDSVGHHGHSSTAGTSVADGGGLRTRFRLLDFGYVPISIVGSILALFMWTFSMLGNYYFNGEPGARSVTFAYFLLVPNFIVSYILTRIAILPLRSLFYRLNHADNESVRVLGSEGKVVSVQVDARYGQVEIVSNGAPVLLNARTQEGAEPVPRGTVVTILSAATEGDFYFITASDANLTP